MDIRDEVLDGYEKPEDLLGDDRPFGGPDPPAAAFF
jgi:hypothetical protein